MKRDDGKLGELYELGSLVVPERPAAAAEAGGLRFVNSVQQLKARAAGNSRRELRRRRALTWALAGCAAAAVLVYGIVRRVEAPSAQQAAATSSELQVELDAQGGEVRRTLDAEGREWFTTEAEGSAAIRMVSDARARLGSNSSAWCWSEPMPSWLHLELGQLDVSVPKLRMGQSLTVHTPNASVIVHGTAFTVQVIGADPPVTTVVVREGTVEVREGNQATFVSAGEVWRSGGSQSTSSLQTEVVNQSPRANAPLPAKPRAAVHRPPQAELAEATASALKSSESSLARENALFREANQARQRGDVAKSEAVLAELLEEFPKSPMRSTALVERAFALTRLGRNEEAAVVARQALSEGASDHVREQLWTIAFGAAPKQSVAPVPSSN